FRKNRISGGRILAGVRPIYKLGQDRKRSARLAARRKEIQQTQLCMEHDGLSEFEREPTARSQTIGRIEKDGSSGRRPTEDASQIRREARRRIRRFARLRRNARRGDAKPASLSVARRYAWRQNFRRFNGSFAVGRFAPAIGRCREQ